MSITRYDIIAHGHSGAWVEKIENGTRGEWCKYTDHLAALAAKEAEIERLRVSLDSYKERYGILPLSEEQRTYIQAGLDAARLIKWWHSDNPKPPALAFTTGPERTIADLLVEQKLAAEVDRTRLVEEIERLRAEVAACRAVMIEAEDDEPMNFPGHAHELTEAWDCGPICDECIRWNRAIGPRPTSGESGKL